MISTPRLDYPVSTRRRSALVRGPVCLPISAADLQTLTGVGMNPGLASTQERIAAATLAVERYLGKVMIAQTWDLWLDDVGGGGFGFWSKSGRGPLYSDYALDLPVRPLLSVIGIYTTGDDNSVTEVDPATYTVSSSIDPGRLSLTLGQTWPYHRGFEGFKVRYVAGYVYPFKAEVGVLTIPNHGYVGGEWVRVYRGLNDRVPDSTYPDTDYQITNVNGNEVELLDVDGNAVDNVDTTAMGNWSFIGIRSIPQHINFGIRMTAVDEFSEDRSQLLAPSGMMSSRTKELLRYDRVVGI